MAMACGALVLAVSLASCSVSGRSSGNASNPFAPGSSISSTTTTTRPAGAGDTPVKPARIPLGYRALNGKDVAVGIAVPTSWVKIQMTGDEITANAKALGKDNPELANLAGSAGGMLSDAVVLAARGTGTFGRRPVATIIQTDLSLPTIPATMGDQFERQFEAAGGKDVSTSMLKVPGLDPDARALSVSVTMAVGGQDAELHEVIVPTSHGLAIIAISGNDKTVDTILSTIAAV